MILALIWGVLMVEGGILLLLLGHNVGRSFLDYYYAKTFSADQDRVIQLLNSVSSGVLTRDTLRKHFLFSGIPDYIWVRVTRDYLDQLSESHAEGIVAGLADSGVFQKITYFLARESKKYNRIMMIELLGFHRTRESSRLLYRLVVGKKGVSVYERMALVSALAKRHRRVWGICMKIIRSSDEFSWLIIAHLFLQLRDDVKARAKILLEDSDERIVMATLFALDREDIVAHRSILLSLLAAPTSEVVFQLALRRWSATNLELPMAVVQWGVEQADTFRLIEFLGYIQAHPQVAYLTFLVNRLLQERVGEKRALMGTIGGYPHVGVSLLEQVADQHRGLLRREILQFLKETHD